jgi:acyl-CoA dehydrogenase
MIGFIWIFAWVSGLSTLAYHKASRQVTALAITMGFILTCIFYPTWYSIIIVIAVSSCILLPLYFPEHRKHYLSAPILAQFKKQLPKMSETESKALQAGTVWWDQELFSGKPQWKKFFSLPAPHLTLEEQDFLSGPVEELCRMLNEWEIVNHLYDLPKNVWDFLKSNGFFALIIPKEYGGRQFSTLAHSEIISKIASKSQTAASIVAVPNSLGPGELLIHYGTQTQKDYFLPRLASGEEMPCFGLTNPEAGSDAASIPDQGIICRGNFNGEEVLGMRLNWDKRYKLHDPDHLLSEKTHLGITCALIPTNLPGISIGDRHKPLATPFLNGPTQGKDVFVPLEFIIGGPERAGHGWEMLMECLSIGRSISLPSSAVGGLKTISASVGAYATIRKQFKKSIGRFEGIEEALARIAGNTYIADATRQVTATVIDNGEAPAILGAIVKYNITERGRRTASDAMDILGGKGIMLGPKNHLAQYYLNAPIMITVEGANILTRSLIVFGQGVMRAHPFMLKEIEIANDSNFSDAIDKFDTILMQHLGHILSNAARSAWLAIIPKPSGKNNQAEIYEINRASSAFSVLADITLLLLGGKLKFKESLSGRLADMLSMMYLASCSLKHFEDQGRQIEDKPLLDWAICDTMNIFWQSVDDLINNFPNKWIACFLRLIVMPLGKRAHRPSDKLGQKVAHILTSPNAARERLIYGAYLTAEENNQAGLWEIALREIIFAESDVADAKLKANAEILRKAVIAVDVFTDKEFN